MSAELRPLLPHTTLACQGLLLHPCCAAALPKPWWHLPVLEVLQDSMHVIAWLLM